MKTSSSDHVVMTINGREAEVPGGLSILDAARSMGIAIPTLCHYRGLTSYGACRVCVVEVQTARGPRIVASCSSPVENNLIVNTDTERVRQARRTVLELLLAQAPNSQELKRFAADLGVDSTPFTSLATDPGKCILCGLCVRVCNELMGRGAVSMFGRGGERQARTAFDERTEQCQACGACAFVCPTGAIDLNRISARGVKPHITKHDQGLTARPCIDLAHPQASPRVPVIDRDNCVHFRTGECGLCSRVCQAGAIDYDQQPRTLRLDVGAVVLTPGFEAFDAGRRGEFGFGFAPNVLTNVQFERMLSASGPTTGHIRRPSDGRVPKRLAFIQCIGSRDAGCDNDYCSGVCCMAATKEAILAREHEPDLAVTIFFLDLRAFGKDFDRFCDRARNQLGVRFVRSFISRTYEMPDTRNIRLVHAGPDVRQVEEEFDMVVLSLGLEPSASMKEQAERLQIVLNRWGFAQTSELRPMDSSRAGIFVAGAFQEPKDIPDTVMQASAAAARAMALLAPARGTRVRTKVYPPERDITDEPPRVGVFVCHCGSNIASVVNVEEVVQQVKDLPCVALAEHNVYTCANDSQGQIRAQIDRHRLNRIVIASCTPRTHEPIFREMLREAGLNPYLLEMANIRDQCSWVHSKDPRQATRKAVQLVSMAAARAASLAPLQQETVPVKNNALIIGGGIAGITASLALADQGFAVHLVESTDQLGGTARQLHHTLDGQDIQAHLSEAIERLSQHPRITAYLNARAEKINGHIGDFTTTIVSSGKAPVEVSHGVVVVATGATEHTPRTYAYGRSDRVITQLQLTDRLGRGELALSDRATVVMIQCVEQRDAERPYCSRVCCTSAVKNALAIKAKYPQARIMVLYRDMRTYGFREAAYREAREKGVLFVRYEPEQPPVLNANGRITLTVREPSLGRNMSVNPDLVVLASPMVPRADRQTLSDLLKVPLNADGFFLEAHMKLRPVDFASEGLFLCGTAHAPKFITETIAQANAVASRAASILSKKRMAVGGQTARVDPNKCISCMTCVHVCPYMAPQVGSQNKAEIQSAVCMGCGSCASECPAQAIELRHYMNNQVLAAVDGLLRPESQEKSIEAVYPEQVGVAQPRWHKGWR